MEIRSTTVDGGTPPIGGTPIGGTPIEGIHIGQEISCRAEVVSELGGHALWAGFVRVTPDLAAEWLAKNTRNRAGSSRIAARYAEVMRRGGWFAAPDAIAFGRDGVLVNGQHRLQAIAESDTAQVMLVCAGLDPEVFTVLDQGRPRTGADALACEGFEDARHLAQTLRHVALARADGLQNNSRVAISEIVALARDLEAALRPSLEMVLIYEKRFVALTLRPGAVVFAHYVWGLAGEEAAAKASRFVRMLATGVGIQHEEEPVALLRELLQENARLPMARLARREKIALLLQALRLHMRGERAQKLVIPPGRAFRLPVIP